MRDSHADNTRALKKKKKKPSKTQQKHKSNNFICKSAVYLQNKVVMFELYLICHACVYKLMRTKTNTAHFPHKQQCWGILVKHI